MPPLDAPGSVSETYISAIDLRQLAKLANSDYVPMHQLTKEEQEWLQGQFRLARFRLRVARQHDKPPYDFPIE
jgi:hypothetical protein